MDHFAAPLDQSPLDTDLHDGQLAQLRKHLQGIERLALAGEGFRFVLVGKNDIDVILNERAQKFQVGLHDIETRQVDRHLQTAGFSRTDRTGNQLVILHQITFDIKTVVTFENSGRNLCRTQLQRSPQERHHRPFPIGRNKRHTPSRALLPPENKGFYTQVLKSLNKEISRLVGSHLADKAHVATQTGHRPDRIAGRSSERERVRQTGDRFRNLGLQGGIHQAHRTFRQIERIEYFVGLQIDQHVCQSVSYSYYAFHEVSIVRK